MPQIAPCLGPSVPGPPLSFAHGCSNAMIFLDLGLACWPLLTPFSLSLSLTWSWKGSGRREGKGEGRGRFLGESLGYK